MWSERFRREVYITHHAVQRMRERSVSSRDMICLIEQGIIRYKNETRFWIARRFPDRRDNLICAPMVLEANRLVVKTVMHHFEWED